MDQDGRHLLGAGLCSRNDTRSAGRDGSGPQTRGGRRSGQAGRFLQTDRSSWADIEHRLEAW